MTATQQKGAKIDGNAHGVYQIYYKILKCHLYLF